MRGEIFLFSGAILITLWGIAHIIPTKSVVGGFGSISNDNRKIITMEWISEGLSLCFLGFLIFSVTFFGTEENPLSVFILIAIAGMLIIMALLTFFTGSKTSIIPIKFCPVIKTITAILVLIGSL